MDVRLGERVLCTIVLDYVPATLRSRLDALEEGLRKGKVGGALFAECEILPGEGFAWEESSRSLRASIPAEQLPAPVLSEDQLKMPLVQRVLELQRRARKAGK